MTFAVEHASLNTLWANLIIEELSRLGVQHCCVAPGSRSAPLTLAAAENESLQKHVHFDERGLGFYALGLAKSTQSPVLVITTSGSAVANLYPAIVEASVTGWPLIVLTADRPPELINCGANQAIVQEGIFSPEYVKQLSLPCPQQETGPHWLLASLDQAWHQAEDVGKCLHINLQLREPLYPGTCPTDFTHYLKHVERWLHSASPWFEYKAADRPLTLNTEDWNQFAQASGVVIVGQQTRQQDAEAILQLSRQLGWPVIADVQSGLHGHKETISRVDLMLESTGFTTMLNRCQHILQFGGRLVSKRLQQWLESRQLNNYWLVDQCVTRLDPGHFISRIYQQRPQEFIAALPKTAIPENKDECNSSYKGLMARLYDMIDDFSGAELNELTVAREVSRHAGKAEIFAGNSLSIRLLDWVGGQGREMKVISNRGASGIDGLLATASGYAEGSNKPLIALMGDLSFLYDLNSMTLAAKLKTPLVIVVPNNDGGGIFNMMPIPDATTATTYFRTPHNLDISKVAPLFGVQAATPATLPEFQDVLQQALDYAGCTLIQIRTPDDEALKLMMELRSCVRESGS
ncbi:2-succinyl-5-enolpyruvyl-6-hydroxy-3-cyclohexene-1-carboxylic-acid synthase [Spongorhabdus nitratireducens]